MLWFSNLSAPHHDQCLHTHSSDKEWEMGGAEQQVFAIPHFLLTEWLNLFSKSVN